MRIPRPLVVVLSWMDNVLAKELVEVTDTCVIQQATIDHLRSRLRDVESEVGMWRQMDSEQ